MHNEDAKPKRSNQGSLSAGVTSRWGQFRRWLSEAMVQRNPDLPPVQQARPHTLDLPPDKGRMQFACWLVEQGKLSEGWERNHEP